MNINFIRLNHIQLCIPKGEEAAAMRFYCDLLELEEIAKPEDLKANGGFWVRIADIELHIGTEEIQCQSKRHPAFEVTGLEEIKEFLREKGVRVKEYNPLPEFNRFSFFDPFNNRIELMEKKTS